MVRSFVIMTLLTVGLMFLACNKDENPTGPEPANGIQTVKLKTGMWWNSTRCDTSVTVIDSLLTKKKARVDKAQIYHSYSTVETVTMGSGSEVNYTIHTWDTLVDPLTLMAVSVSDTVKVLTHKDAAVFYSTIIDTLGLKDTITVTWLKLPVQSNTSWSMVDFAFDTTVYFPFTMFSIKLRGGLATKGTSTVGDMQPVSFANVNHDCYPIASQMNLTINVIKDTTIALGPIIFVQKGDTALRVVSDVSGAGSLSKDFTIALKTQQITTSLIDNRLYSTMQYDTIRSSTIVTKVLDPTTDQVVGQ
jgi:hypothetical protein